MTDPEPYRDPDGPIHAVLAAADAAEPRVRLVGEGALIHARYVAPRKGPRTPIEEPGEEVTAPPAEVPTRDQRTWWERLTNQPLNQDDYMAVEGP